MHRPLVLLVPDLAEYEREVGLYLDYRSEMIGTQVADTPAVAAAILANGCDLGPYEDFVTRHLGAANGGARARFVDRFVTSWAGGEAAGVADATVDALSGDRLRSHVSHE